MKTIKIASVPEHFNLPWHLGIESGEFEKNGIDLQWTDVPEGTGKMCQMLRSGETDIAVILSEGIVKDITADNPSKIIQVYVESPLIWGIHVAANSNYKKLSDLEDKKVAISRIGSGSQLMAYVNANNLGWETKKLEFEIVNTIEGAVESLSNGTSDYFMWEKFMTKPLVDNGVFRRIGECPTPWPCFVVAVRTEFLNDNIKILKSLLNCINIITSDFKNISNIENLLATKYNQKIEDIKEWLLLTQWSNKSLTKKQFNLIQNQLFDLNIINKKSIFEDVVNPL